MFLSVCAIFRDETPFLQEWIRFHQLQGVEHFFLYDNNSVDGPEEVLREHIDAGNVTLIPWPNRDFKAAQSSAYMDGLERVRERSQWMASIDIDEFLFSPTGKSVPDVLAGYAEGGVFVHWRNYGSSGLVEAEPDVPVISRFTRRAPSDWVRNRRGKCIVRPGKTIGTLGPHFFEMQKGETIVNESGAPMTCRPVPKWFRRLSRKLVKIHPRLPVDPYQVRHMRPSIPISDILRINHYPLKSRQEFMQKRNRYWAPEDGKDSRKHTAKGDAYFAYHDRNDADDPILLPDAAKL